MLEYSVPICFVEHLNKVVFECVGTFRDRVQNDIPRKSHSDLLENQSSFSDHKHRVVFHFVESSLLLGGLAIRVLVYHGHLGVLSFKERLKSHKVKVAWHQ